MQLVCWFKLQNIESDNKKKYKQMFFNFMTLIFIQNTLENTLENMSNAS